MKYLAAIMLLISLNSAAITTNTNGVTLSPKELEQLRKYQDDVTNTIINKELIIIEQQKQIEKLKAMRNCV